MAVVPLTAALLIVWWLDRYEREPLWVLLLTFVWGAAGATTLSMCVSGSGVAILGSLGIGEDAQSVIAAIVFAPPVEELEKGAVLGLLLWWPKSLDSFTDGVIYGSASGLGFALTENFVYFLEAYKTGGFEAWVTTVVLRTLFTAAMHALASGIVGGVIGFAYQRGVGAAGGLAAAAAGYVIAMLVHFGWNSLAVASTVTEQPAFTAIGMILVVAAVFVYFLVLNLSVLADSRMIRRELMEEVSAGLIPEEHARVVSNAFRRNRLQLPHSIPVNLYIGWLVRLAMVRSRAKPLDAVRLERSLEQMAILRRNVWYALHGIRVDG